MIDAVQEELASSSSSSEESDRSEDEASLSSEDTEYDTDSDTLKEEEDNRAACCSLKLDHHLQKILFELEDDDEAEQAAAGPQSLSQNLTMFKDDLCGWVPGPSVQYRRTAAEKQPPKAGRTGSKQDGATASSRRLLNCRFKYGHIHQQSHKANNNVEYEFKHFGNYRKYSEQYRRLHTCGGPLQKLTTQSALGGRPRTIYYAGDATAEAGVEIGRCTPNTVSNTQEPRSGQVTTGKTLRMRVLEKPCSTSQPIISYSDISVNSPRFKLADPTHHRKPRALKYEWTETPPEGVRTSGSNGRQTLQTPSQGQWNVATNHQTLSVYTSKPPGSLPASACSATPPKPHFPFFPTQQPLRQLTKTISSLTSPSLNSSNDMLPSGYSLDKTLGAPAGYSTGISRNLAPHRDFYSQLMHAAHCLSLAAKSPKDFDFELPRWPTCTSNTGISTQPQTSNPEKPSANSLSTSSSSSNANSMQVQLMGRGVNTSPTSPHQSRRSTSQPRKQQQQQQQQQQQDRQKFRKSASTFSTKNPTSATETHFITIEAPTCSPFDTRSAKQVRRDAAAEEVGVSKAASYRVALKEKPVVPEIKETTSVNMVADANRPLAVCEVTWF